jgi:hypothetical protein
MTPAEVRAILESELAGDWSKSNSHGVDLKACVVEPRKVTCRSTFPKLNGGKSLQLWIVLEETPGKSDGYLIVFDDLQGKFGLADWNGSTPVFLGYYGSFLNTLESM